MSAPRSRRPLRGAFLPVSFVLLVSAAYLVPLPVFLERPGDLVSLGDAVDVGVPAADPLDGDFLLTTVTVRRGTVASVAATLFDDHAAVLPLPDVIPPGVAADVFFARQREVFQATADVAAAVALRAAGYDVEPSDFTGDGALVVQVVPSSAADGVLEEGDLIVAVDGRSIGTGDDLREAITNGPADTPRTVTFLRDGERRTTELTPRAVEAAGVVQPVLGVRIETVHPRIDLPVPVEVDSRRIGGPSAGLMIALTVYDKLEPVDLAGDRLVAGTGTVDRGGAVGPIGGIGQKVIVAARAEVDVFLAPAGQAAEAVAAVPTGSDLEVVPVSSFDEAVAALQEGGVAIMVAPPW